MVRLLGIYVVGSGFHRDHSIPIESIHALSGARSFSMGVTSAKGQKLECFK